jgi:galactose mutarotase-like enzyme
MKNTIGNDSITFVSESYNVEPWVLKFNNDADETANYFWRPADKKRLGTAVCFPMMGMLPDGTYVFEGKKYSLGMHGFAQDREFSISEKSDKQVVYELTDDAASRAQYPWRFKFSLAYSVDGAALKTEYRIENRDEKEMYFTVGGHPRFACPIGKDGRFEDCYVEFEKAESVENIIKSYGPISEIEKCFSHDGKRLRLDYGMFLKGCFCFRPINSKRVWLKSAGTKRSLLVDIGEANHLQFWTEPGGPFICIEPIYGSTSHLPMIPEDADWKARPGTLHLRSGETYTCGYSVTISK